MKKIEITNYKVLDFVENCPYF